jgi:hypothetical protein
MNSFTKIVGTAVTAIVLTTSFAQAFQGNGNTTTTQQRVDIQVKAIKAVGCLVAGSPSEFPDDIWIENKGNTVLKAGTKVKWDVPFSSDKGTHTLVADLGAGKGVQLSGVLPGGVEAGHDCKAKL